MGPVMNRSSTPHKVDSGLTINGRHVLFGLLAFFAIVLVADTYLIYKAVSTFGGLETEDAWAVIAVSEANGVRERTLKSAKSALAVKSFRCGKGWKWRLPSVHEPFALPSSRARICPDPRQGRLPLSQFRPRPARSYWPANRPDH